MKRSLSMYTLSAVGAAVVLTLAACGKKEDPKTAAPAASEAPASMAAATTANGGTAPSPIWKNRSARMCKWP